MSGMDGCDHCHVVCVCVHAEVDGEDLGYACSMCCDHALHAGAYCPLCEARQKNLAERREAK